MAGTVDIVLPSGEAATVAPEELEQAIAAGASMPSEAGGGVKDVLPSKATLDEINGVVGLLGGGAGALANPRATGAAVLGAARTATFGLSDALLAEGSNLLSGESARKETLGAIRDIGEANPIATGAGELGGLFIGAGKGVTALGEAVEKGVAPRVGEGLLGEVASMSARGAVESTLLGAQHQITEDTLGDHEYNAEALFSNAAKEGLIGGGLGAGLGLLGHGLGRARGLLDGAVGRTPGPLPTAALDEIAGVDGAGRGVRDAASRSQSAVDAFQRTGATSEQATQLVDQLETMGKARSRAGFGAGLLDDAAERYAAMHGGERGDLIRQHYADSAKHALDTENVLDAQARKLAEAGTKAMRGLEDTSNQVHFTERPEQFARLLDPTSYTAARDGVARMGQDVRALVGELDMLPTKGGVDVGVSRIGKQLKEFDAVIEHLPSEGGTTAMRDAYMAGYRLKQAVGKYAGFGKPAFLRTPGENALTELYESLRVGLEDEAAFGAAGAANRDWNAAFSDDFGRRRDFGNRFSVSIDEVSGEPRAEIDAGKVKGFLRQIGGAEADQSVKSIESTIDWMRARANRIEQYADLTAAQRSKLAEGRAALDEFEATFQAAQKEAAIANRIRAATVEERGAGIGGLLGVVGDTVTRPLETARRLAQIRRGVDAFESSVRGMVRHFGELGNSVGSPATQIAPRARKEVVREMEAIRELASNQRRLQEAADRLVGDLGNHAPRTANALRLTAMRALLYLAREAPPASISTIGPTSLFDKDPPAPRYSDTQVHEWETKRNAVFDPKSIVDGLKRGHANRDAIEAARFGNPRAFARIQALAREELEQMRKRGVLDDLEYSKRAPFANLLDIPVDQTWTPEFMLAMQTAKQAAPEVAGSSSGRRAPPATKNKFANALMTEASKIESGGSQNGY